MVTREHTTSPEMGWEIITADATRHGPVPLTMAIPPRRISTQTSPATTEAYAFMLPSCQRRTWITSMEMHMGAPL
jgi:hypothetical protein